MMRQNRKIIETGR